MFMDSPWNKLKIEQIMKQEELTSLKRFLTDDEIIGKIY